MATGDGHKTKQKADLSEFDLDSIMEQVDVEAPKLPREKRTINLPHGYEVECNDPDEYAYVMRSAQSYLKRAEEVPVDYGAVVHMQIMNFLTLYRIDKKLGKWDDVSDDEKGSAEEYKDLLTQRNRVQSVIKEAIKNDPLKWKSKTGDKTMPELFQEQVDAGLAYAKDHIGEYRWQCAKCGTVHLHEVPHFAFDPAYPGAVWNQVIFEMVRRHYAPADPEVKNKYESSLSVADAAMILDVSPIGILAIAMERGFDLGFKFDLNKPESFIGYIGE